jgi:hypothetical protein
MWVACALASARGAHAQDKARAKETARANAGSKRKPEPEAKSKAVKRRSEAAERGKGQAVEAKPQPARAESKPARSSSAPPPLAADDLAGNVRSEGGTEVKTLEFSGLDIEGQLKSPQMMYFLKRVRAEFEHPRLPHRSFMPELARSTEERDF